MVWFPRDPGCSKEVEEGRGESGTLLCLEAVAAAALSFSRSFSLSTGHPTLLGIMLFMGSTPATSLIM